MFACGPLDCSLSLIFQKNRADVRPSWVLCPKSRFHSHPQAKPGTFETKYYHMLDLDDFTEKQRTVNSLAGLLPASTP